MTRVLSRGEVRRDLRPGLSRTQKLRLQLRPGPRAVRPDHRDRPRLPGAVRRPAVFPEPRGQPRRFRRTALGAQHSISQKFTWRHLI